MSSSCVRSANDGEPSRVERCHVVQSDARARRPTPSHAKSVWITGTKSIYNTQLTGEGERDGSPPRLNDINMSPRETADGKTDKTAKTDDQRTGGGYYFQIKNSFFFLLLLLFSLFSLHNDDVVTWLRGVGPRSQPYGGTVKDRTAFFFFVAVCLEMEEKPRLLLLILIFPRKPTSVSSSSRLPPCFLVVYLLPITLPCLRRGFPSDQMAQFPTSFIIPPTTSADGFPLYRRRRR